MDLPNRKRLDHEPPDWVGPEAEYFITVCASLRGQNHFCDSTLGPFILDSIRYRNDKHVWYCRLAVLMPDYIHLVLNFPPEQAAFNRIMGSWKHWLSRRHAISWQKNFFDHRLREGEHTDDKELYILENPVRAGLAKNIEDWPYVFVAD